jgi:nicotinamide mononucleotide transporter
VIDTLLAELRATTPIEAIAVLLGIVYVVLILQRRRVGWMAGTASAALYVYLAFEARLPMQSLLQLWYVAMGVYGWYRWKRNTEQEGGRIRRWPALWHLVPVVAIVIASALTACYLAAETQAAWPWLDSLTTWSSLFATWLATRVQLENWLYWIITDLVTAFLFGAQGHLLTAGLFIMLSIIACFGFLSWQRQYQAQPA